MTARRMLLCQESMHGLPDIATCGVAVLFGTTTAELGKWADLDGDRGASDKLPDWLIQQGRRRSGEGRAATDNATLIAVLTHWAIRDYGAGVIGFDVVITDALRQLWMIVTPEAAQQISGETERS